MNRFFSTIFKKKKQKNIQIEDLIEKKFDDSMEIMLSELEGYKREMVLAVLLKFQMIFFKEGKYNKH